jgi:predicted regulator of Ras-like GTPase activity (Roadblock/LC7/MglB family)
MANAGMTGSALRGEVGGILRELNRAGGFAATVLTDGQGLVLAAESAPGQDANAQAAVVALVEKTAGRVVQQLGMAPTDEISVFDAQGRRLVWRPFAIGEKTLILSVLVLDKGKSYRQLTNRGIRALQRILESL